MAVDKRTLIAAKNVLWSREAFWLLYDPNVVMIDFGHPESQGETDYDTGAVRFHVRQKYSDFGLEMAIENGNTREPLPNCLGGLPTDVQEHDFRLNAWPWWLGSHQPAQAGPLQGGMSISDEFRYAAGTLGGIVKDRRSGDLMILSNWHVLAAGWHANPRHRVFQPGRSDSGSAQGAVAHFTRHAMFQHLDAAVATLIPDTRDYSSSQTGLRRPASGVASPRPGMRVVKSGRTTGVTRGIIQSLVNGFFKMTYQGIEHRIGPALIIEPLADGQEVSAAGDSGSFWFEEDTMRAVGLHFAGSNGPERAIAIEMPAVLNALGVDLFLR